jgi:hypothetical protein
MESTITLEIEEVYQQKILKWKENSSPEGKQLVQRASISLNTYFIFYIAATTPKLLL